MAAKTGEARLNTLEETRRCALGSELPTWRRTSPAKLGRPLIVANTRETKDCLNSVARNSSNALSSADFSLNYQVTTVDRHIGS
jgi:hypothetical protein